MYRPLVVFAFGLLLTLLGDGLGVAWLPAALLGAVLAVGLARRALLLPALVALMGAWVGLLALARVDPPGPPAPLHAEVEVQLDRFPDPPGEGRRALEGRVVATAPEGQALAGLRVRLGVPGWSGPFEVGERLRVRTAWRPAHAGWLAARGVRAEGQVARPPLIVGRAEGVLPGVARVLQGARDGLAARLARAAPSVAPLVQALVLGIRVDLDPADRDTLARTGTLHLIAISGLHLGILAALVFGLARALLGLSVSLRLRLLDRTLGAWFTLVLAAGFTALTGAAVSTTRAFVMLALYLGARLTGREVDPLSFLAGAVAALLAWNPRALADPAFQLSVAGVAALLLAGRVRAPARGRRVFQAVVASWLAALVTTPIVFLHFGRAPLAAPLANLLALPVFSLLVLPLALLVVALAVGAPVLAGFAARPLGALLEGGLGALRALASWAPAPEDPRVFAAVFALWAGATVAGAWWWRGRGLAAEGRADAPIKKEGGANPPVRPWRTPPSGCRLRRQRSRP